MAKILLVEDDNNLREIYQARLAAEGYDIVAAQNGEEALVMAKQNKPDLIISDVMMPRISGFEMLDILRNTDELKDTKVIMLTALGQAEDQTRADSLGADKYLVKSQVTLEDIVNAAKDLLGETEAAVSVTPSPAAESQPAPTEPVPAGDDVTPVPETPVPAVAMPVASEPVEPPAPEPDTAPVTDADTAEPVPAPILSVEPATPEPVVPASVAPQPDTVVVVPPAPANPTPPIVSVAPLTPDPAAPSTDDVPSEPTTPATIPAPVAPSTEPAGAISSSVPLDTDAVDPQSIKAEEAAVQAQINDFAEAPSDPEPTSNDQAIAHAVEELNGTSEAPAEPAAAPSPLEEPSTVAPPSGSAAESTPTIAPSAAPTQTTNSVGGTKIIQPLNSDAAVGPNLEELLAQEEAKEIADKPVDVPSGGTPISPTTPPPSTSGVDPNSIAL